VSRASLVIVVVEDGRHKMFVYRYLRHHRDLRRDEIRLLTSPPGIGSAERWVLERFAVEVGTYRSRHPETRLIAVVDADVGSVQHRFQQFDEALTATGKPGVDVRTERIARLVPKRNIETWVLCLNGEIVDEDTDYKRDGDWTEKIRLAAKPLFEWMRRKDDLPNHCIPSLRTGVAELKRLEF
jgi:hypothetical protein